MRREREEGGTRLDTLHGGRRDGHDGQGDQGRDSRDLSIRKRRQLRARRNPAARLSEGDPVDYGRVHLLPVVRAGVALASEHDGWRYDDGLWSTGLASTATRVRVAMAHREENDKRKQSQQEEQATPAAPRRSRRGGVAGARGLVSPGRGRLRG